MSATRKSSQPELSPRGAETRRSARPLKSRPAGTPVSRSSRSMRPCGEASSCPPARRDAVEVLAGLEHAARGAARAARRRPARARARRSRAAASRRSRAAATSSSGGIGRSVGAGVALRREAPAEDALGERLGSRRSPARARLAGSNVALLDARRAGARWPSASRRSRIAPARTSAGAETTSPVGWTKPSHSRCARICGIELAPSSVRLRPEVDEADRLDALRAHLVEVGDALGSRSRSRVELLEAPLPGAHVRLELAALLLVEVERELRRARSRGGRAPRARARAGARASRAGRAPRARRARAASPIGVAGELRRRAASSCGSSSVDVARRRREQLARDRVRRLARGAVARATRRAARGVFASASRA